QSCINGFCSADSCPTSGFSTDYCQVTPDPLCLSDVDNDRVADNLDCNDVSTAIGQCDGAQCKQCNEDSSANNDRGICVNIPDCVVPVDCSVSSLDVSQDICINADCKWSGNTLKCGATCQGNLVERSTTGLCEAPAVVNTLDECTIRNPRWNDLRDTVISQSFDDYIVKLKTDVQNCNGLSIRFEIAENDGLFGVNIDPSVDISDITNVEVRNGVAIGEWEVNYIENADSVLGISNNPEYVFKAVVVDNQGREKETGWSGNLNVDIFEIVFTGNSIRNGEDIAKLNDIWKIEVNLREDRDHVYVVFDRSDEVSLDDNGNMIVSESIPFFEMRKSGTVYPTNRNLFLNALSLANDVAMPLGGYSYQIIVFDDDFREGKRSSVRTFNIVETPGTTPTCIGLARDDCITSSLGCKWSGSSCGSSCAAGGYVESSANNRICEIPQQDANPITITVQNPNAAQEFTSSPVTFTLNIGTSEALSLNQCRYAFKRGRYAQTSLPAFGGMTNFENINPDGRSQNSQILFSNYDIYSRFGDGEYGYYIRCENGANIGERLGHIIVAINAPPPIEVEPIILSVEANEGSPGRIECPANHVVSSANARYYCPNNPSNLIVCNVEKYIGRNYASALFDHQTEGSECRGDDPCPGVVKRGSITIGCVPTGSVLPKTECEDGIDNDKNGCADFGVDLGCDGIEDNNEEGRTCPSGLTQCSDGVDNDGDGCVDLDNEGDCTVLRDNTEVGSVCSSCINTGNEICDDGKDNNCNGQLDCAESSCSGNAACQTTPPGGTPPPGVTGECTVSSIRWVNTETEATISSIEEGQTAYTLIEGSDCNIGETVNYNIREKEGGNLLDLLFPDEDILVNAPIRFTSDRIMLISWVATRQEDARNPNNAYYIKIGNVESSNLNVVARTGVAACVPSAEVCSDGRDNDCDGQLDCLDSDCRGNAACTGQITPLIIRNMGPSSSIDFNFELFITLGGGSGGNGNAECYWDEVPNPQMNLDTLIPGAFANRFSNFRNEFSGGVFNTRYYTNIIRPNGEHNFYERCRDSEGANIPLQTMTTRVNVPDANRLRILNVAPNGITYGVRNVDVNVNTAGGRGSGANVRCSYSGSGLTGNLNPVLSSGNIYTHSANIQNVPVGNNVFTVTCTDDAETLTSNINFNVALDTTAPQIVQIVTSGTKYIRTNEEALCRLSTTSNVDAGADLIRDDSRKIHSVVTSSSYYVRCRDNWGNVGNIVRVNV
ncbi:MAG: hypothetical protein HY361_00695, partial [Candidatus Aenigmarchaeota archaeon]|nr:hypothetical protein [Candidatus Aenigmarchaeota archaeon]